MHQLIRGKLDTLGDMNAQIDVSWAAQAAVTDTLPPAARLPGTTGVTAEVIALHPAALSTAADAAFAATDRYLGRCKLAVNTVRAYRRQCRAYLSWLAERADEYPDAFVVGAEAEAAVTA